MNTWNESDWFKTWLTLARQGQTGSEQLPGVANDSSPSERFGIKPVGSVEHAPEAEMQVTE